MGAGNFQLRQKVENWGIFQKHMFEQPGQFSEKNDSMKIVKIERTSTESGVYE